MTSPIPTTSLNPEWLRRLTHPTLWKRLSRILLIIGAVGIALFQLSPSMSAKNTVILALVFAISAVGLNIITGYAGYLSLAQGTFLGIGAYTGAILSRNFPDVSPFVWVPLGGIVAAGMAMILGLVTYRTRGSAFVIITIAFTLLVQFVARIWRDVTNGSNGITLPLPDWPDAWGDWPFHIALVALLALSLLTSWGVRRTKFGTGLIAIRDDEGKAGTIGINAPVYKLLAFGLSTLFTGMAGAVYGYYLTFVDPTGMFPIMQSLLIVLALILGGRGTLWGPVLGAFVIMPVSTWANNLFTGGNFRLVILGGLLILLVILLPKGILPSLEALRKRIYEKGTVGLSGKRLEPATAPAVVTPRERPADAKPLLEVKNLHKAFGANLAVDGTSFVVPEGSISALIGPNGSGKTTVFNLISGVMTPDAGEIVFDGKPIQNLSPWGRAHAGIGRTFQITRLFKEMTVLENVVAPLRDFEMRQLGAGAVSGAEARRAEELLRFVGVVEYKDVAARELSYGQQKLVELAQVLMLDPKLIMLDEPAGGINPTLIERMGGLIRELNAQGTTFLLVEHNMPFVLGLCDPIQVLARGKVIGSGTPAEIQNNPAVLDAYLGDDFMLEGESKTASIPAVKGRRR
jgi:branched-chain amino acid transport system permease protein